MNNPASNNKGRLGKNTIAIIIALIVVAAVSGAVLYLRFAGSNLVSQTKLLDVAAVPAEDKTINMIGQWQGEDKRENFLTETIKEFETRNPSDHVKIKWNGEFDGGREGAIQATIDQFKTGHIAWDVIWLEPFYYQEIATGLNDRDWAKHFLVDFEAVPGFKDTQKSFILSDPQYRNHMNGVITGPYVEGFYQPLFYNKELANKIGLTVKGSGMTFDDLLGYFKQIDDYNKANHTSIPILYDSGDYKGGIGYAPSTYNIFQSLFRSEFSSLPEVENTVSSNSKMVAVKKVLGSLEQLSKYKPLIAGWQGLDWYGTSYYVLDDKAVFTAAGPSSLYSHWHGIDPAKTMKMVPVELPVYQPVDHYMGGYNPMFAVAKDSPVRAEAVKLLMSFTTPNMAEKWIRYAKGPSGIKGNISKAGGVSVQTDQFDNFITYITDKYGSNVFDSKTVDYILGDQYKDLTLKFSIHLGDVMDGKATADAAYAAIVKDMQNVDKNNN